MGAWRTTREKPRKRRSATLGFSLATTRGSSSAGSSVQAMRSHDSHWRETMRSRLAPSGSGGVSTTIVLVLPAGKPRGSINGRQPSEVSTSSRVIIGGMSLR